MSFPLCPVPVLCLRPLPLADLFSDRLEAASDLFSTRSETNGPLPTVIANPGTAPHTRPLARSQSPCHPSVPSLPEDGLVWFIVIAQKETGGVQYPPFRFFQAQCWLGKGSRVGSTAASVVSSACVGPLGINHDLRRVGGLCACTERSAHAYQRSPKSAAVGG